MSFFGGILKKVGHVLGGAAKFAGLIPGVSTLGAALLGGAGGLLDGGGVKGALEGAALGASGPLLGKVLGHIPGVRSLGEVIGGDGVPDAAAGVVPGMSGDALTGATGGLVRAATQPQGIGGALKRAGGAILGAIEKHPDLALAAADTLEGAHQQAIADERLNALDRDAKARYQQGLGILDDVGPAPTIPDPAQGAQYRRSAYRRPVAAVSGGGY